MPGNVNNTKQGPLRVNRKSVPAAVKRDLGKEFDLLSDTSGLTKRVWVEDQWAVHPCNQGSKKNPNKAFDQALYDQRVAKLEEDYQERLSVFQKTLEELNGSDTEQPEDKLSVATIIQEQFKESPSVTSDVPNLPDLSASVQKKNARGNFMIESDGDSEQDPEEGKHKIKFAGTHIHFNDTQSEEPDNEEPDNEDSEKSFTSAETHDGDSGDDSDEPNCEKDTHDGDSADELSTLRKKLANMTKAFADNATEVLVASQQRDFQQEKDMIIRMYFEIENYKREEFLEAINSAELGDYSILNAVQEEHAEIFN